MTESPGAVIVELKGQRDLAVERVQELEAEVERLKSFIYDHGCNLAMVYEMEEGGGRESGRAPKGPGEELRCGKAPSVREAATHPAANPQAAERPANPAALRIRAYTSVPADPSPIHDAANHEPCPGCPPAARKEAKP